MLRGIGTFGGKLRVFVVVKYWFLREDNNHAML
jgi:hypothetical protein